LAIFDRRLIHRVIGSSGHLFIAFARCAVILSSAKDLALPASSSTLMAK
jgi:hypothetical protein